MAPRESGLRVAKIGIHLMRVEVHLGVGKRACKPIDAPRGAALR